MAFFLIFKDSVITNEMTVKYINAIGNCEWSTLGAIISELKSIYVIHLNATTWQNSHFTCRYDQKDYMCYHIIALAYFLNLTSFEDAAIKTRLGPKQGRDKK